MRVFVTGGGGFVGQALCRRLLAGGHNVVAGLRQPRALPEGVEPYLLGSLEKVEPLPLAAALRECEALVHLAGRAHVMREREADSAEAFRQANVVATERLACAAQEARVKRVLFMSSIKALGERTVPGDPFRHDSRPAPEDNYGRSKLAAEHALAAALEGSDSRLAILRPPLVYGPAVRGNFLSLLGLVSRGFPLPFGAATKNRRSFVAVENLADAVAHLLEREVFPTGPFLVSDGEDISTARLIRRLAEGMGREARLVPIPVSLMASGARLLGWASLAERLLGNLQVDTSRLTQEAGWHPPSAGETAMQETARWFQEQLASSSGRG